MTGKLLPLPPRQVLHTAAKSIELRDVGHSYVPGDFLFRHLFATFQAGHMIAVTGPSGSGKSTLLAVLAGWLEPTEGRVVRTSIRTIHWVPQLPLGVAQRTTIDHVALPLLISGHSYAQAYERAEAILGDFDLLPLADHRYDSLSGGEAQRLMLARASASSCDMILVDEPTASLDRMNARTVIGHLGALGSAGCIVIVATHDADVWHECDTALRLDDGGA